MKTNIQKIFASLCVLCALASNSPAQFNTAVMTDSGGNLVSGFTVSGTNLLTVSGSLAVPPAGTLTLGTVRLQGDVQDPQGNGNYTLTVGNLGGQDGSDVVGTLNFRGVGHVRSGDGEMWYHGTPLNIGESSDQATINLRGNVWFNKNVQFLRSAVIEASGTLTLNASRLDLGQTPVKLTSADSDNSIILTGAWEQNIGPVLKVSGPSSGGVSADNWVGISGQIGFFNGGIAFPSFDAEIQNPLITFQRGSMAGGVTGVTFYSEISQEWQNNDNVFNINFDRSVGGYNVAFAPASKTGLSSTALASSLDLHNKASVYNKPLVTGTGANVQINPELIKSKPFFAETAANTFDSGTFTLDCSKDVVFVNLSGGGNSFIEPYVVNLTEYNVPRHVVLIATFMSNFGIDFRTAANNLMFMQPGYGYVDSHVIVNYTGSNGSSVFVFDIYIGYYNGTQTAIILLRNNVMPD